MDDLQLFDEVMNLERVVEISAFDVVIAQSLESFKELLLASFDFFGGLLLNSGRLLFKLLHQLLRVLGKLLVTPVRTCEDEKQ